LLLEELNQTLQWVTYLRCDLSHTALWDTIQLALARLTVLYHVVYRHPVTWYNLTAVPFDGTTLYGSSLAESKATNRTESFETTSFSASRYDETDDDQYTATSFYRTTIGVRP
jgi:hypothetical protein